jgi:hypothetical protein
VPAGGIGSCRGRRLQGRAPALRRNRRPASHSAWARRDRPGPAQARKRLGAGLSTVAKSARRQLRLEPRRRRFRRRLPLRCPARSAIPVHFPRRRRLDHTGPLGRISCNGSSRSTRSVAPSAALGCESCPRSQSPRWHVGSWRGSIGLRGRRRTARPQKGPGAPAPSRLPSWPGMRIPDSISINRFRSKSDARPRVGGRRSSRFGRVDSLGLAAGRPWATSRGEPSTREPSLKSPPEGAK